MRNQSSNRKADGDRATWRTSQGQGGCPTTKGGNWGQKQATYALGVQETQNRLTKEFSAVARDYCNITWGKALDVAGIPADSSLRRLKSIYNDSDIRELPGSGSPPPEQPAQVSEAPTAD